MDGSQQITFVQRFLQCFKKNALPVGAIQMPFVLRGEAGRGWMGWGDLLKHSLIGKERSQHWTCIDQCAPPLFIRGPFNNFSRQRTLSYLVTSVHPVKGRSCASEDKELQFVAQQQWSKFWLQHLTLAQERSCNNVNMARILLASVRITVSHCVAYCVSPSC